MENLNVFENSNFGKIEITISENNEPLFKAGDVALILWKPNWKNEVGVGIPRPRMNELRNALKINRGQESDPLKKDDFITEDQLYMACMKSNSEIAIPFQMWVVKEVLPTIRKTGGYIDPSIALETIRDPEFIQNILDVAKEEKAKREAVEAELLANKPKIEYHDRILESVDTWITTTVAKDYGISAMRLNQILCNERIQYKRDNHWILYSQYQDLGLVNTKTYEITHSDDSPGSVIHTRWTEKGRQFIHDLIVKKYSELLPDNQ